MTREGEDLLRDALAGVAPVQLLGDAFGGGAQAGKRFLGAQCGQGCFGRTGVARVDREAQAFGGQGLDHGQESASFLRRGDGFGPGASGFRTEVEGGRTLAGETPSVFDRIDGMEAAAPVGEGIRCQVHDAHDAGSRGGARPHHGGDGLLGPLGPSFRRHQMWSRMREGRAVFLSTRRGSQMAPKGGGSAATPPPSML